MNERDMVTLLLKNDVVHDRKFELYRVDRSKIWISMSATLVKNEDGEPLRIESFISDITRRKQAEQDKANLQGQLVQAQKLEAVSQLAGGVAHDFNNMLAVILGRTELALLKVKADDTFYTTFIEIQKAAEHSADLTRQLLAFARKQTVAPVVMDINQKIDSTLDMLRRLIGEDIELIHKPASKLWKVCIDPSQVSQILANLCVNVRDAINGIGQIYIETSMVSLDRSSISIPGTESGDYVSLSVKDTGCGMDKATQDHIFEPFFTTKDGNQGTGLGLATVYGIVKQNNAHITLESEPLMGTTITIYLSRFEGEKTKQQIKLPREMVPAGREVVLLVEDESSLLDLTQNMLEELGYKMLSASAPTEAIHIAEDYSKDLHLLLTDVVMPKMNGRDLALRIKEIRPHIKCLFMSGYTSNIIANRGILEKGISFIPKPFSVHSLATKIHEAL